MQQVKHGNAAEDSGRRYETPSTRAVFVKMQSILCISNPDANTTEMEEGDDNW